MKLVRRAAQTAPACPADTRITTGTGSTNSSSSISTDPSTLSTAPGPMPTVITAVIQAASAEGWLEELVTKAWQKFPKNPELHSFVLEAALTPANEVVPASTLSRELEKAVLARVKFDNPAEFRERMSRSERAVCRIELPKPEWGTGFLVGPDTVMTNYHVIEDLEIGVQHRDQVVVRFDYELGADGRPLAGGRRASWRPTDGCWPTAGTTTWISPCCGSTARSAPSRPRTVRRSSAAGSGRAIMPSAARTRSRCSSSSTRRSRRARRPTR